MRTGIKRVTALIIAIFFTQIALLAQNSAREFYISSFKPLELDLDARTLHPVIDQNGKKTALIKVVTTQTGFDFDIGVMGITEVHQEVGEIWVYIPEKAQRITIRHPKFGVIRDYFFPVAIESATTYEMRLKTPETNQERAAQRLVIEHKFATQESNILPVNGKAGTDRAAEQEKGADYRKGRKNSAQKEVVGRSKIEYKGFLLLADVGINKSPSYGIRAGYYKLLGGYVNIRSNFSSADGNYSCTSDGSLENGSPIWTTGKEKQGRFNVTAGVMSQLTNWLGAYAGAGYGSSTLAWEDINGEWAKVEDFSHKGLALDAGLVFNVKNFAISAGINSIAFEWCEFSLGFGVRF